MKKLFFNLAVFLLASAVLFLVSCKGKEEAVSSSDPGKGNVTLSDMQAKHVGLDTAKAVNEESELILTGKISFDEDKVAKVFPLVSGNVIKVNVSMGDYVKRNEVLAVLRSADISSFQSQYQVSLSNLQVAKKNLEIAEELYKTNVNSEKDFLNAQNEYKKAESEKNHLKEQLSIFGVTENTVDAEYKVTAPTEGFVVEKNISENMEIRSDNAGNIFTVSSLQTVWVLANVYESDVSKISEGSEAEITTIAYPDKVFKGTIQRIGNLFDANTKTLRIRIVLDNPEGLLKPEMFAKVKVFVKKPNKVISVPTSSLVFEGGDFYVMVHTKELTFHKTPIKLIKSMDKLSFIEGINDKDVVATNGSLYVAYKVD